MRGPRLCGACGARPAVGDAGKDCASCGAPPTAWELEQGQEGWIARVTMSLVMLGSGLACFAAVLALLSGWAFPSVAWKVVQAVLGLVVVPFGTLTGAVLVYGSVEGLVMTTWRWKDPVDGEGQASAKVVLGRLKSAQGRRARVGTPLPVPAMRASPVELFRSLKTVRAEALKRASLGIGTPPTVDLLLVFGIVRLAYAGVMEIAVRESRSWDLKGVGAWCASPSPLMLRRGTARPSVSLNDPVSVLLLAALAQFDLDATTKASVVGEGAYRRGALGEELPPGPWVRLSDLLDALVPLVSLQNPRQSIRDRMRHHAEIASDSTLSDEAIVDDVRGVVAWRVAGETRAIVPLLLACLTRLSPRYRPPGVARKDMK